MTAAQKFYYYPLWLRIWHGINAIGILILIYSGISLQSSLESPQFISFNTIVNLHNITGVIVSLSYLVYFVGNIVTSNGKFYMIKPKGFLSNPLKQAKYYIWGMFNGQKPPFPLSEKRKFNPLQKYSYIIVMYFFIPIVIFTGFALLFPESIIDKVYNFSGVFLTALLHSAMGFLISIFLVVHLYIASIGKSPIQNFKSIINGWHEVH